MTMRNGDEETAKEGLQRKIGYLFPNGITDIIFDFLVAYDAHHIPKKELEELCRKVGVSYTGDKKLLAARLLANEFGLREK